jgi:hypothetical protein
MTLLALLWKSLTNHSTSWIISKTTLWLIMCILPIIIKRFSNIDLILNCQSITKLSLVEPYSSFLIWELSTDLTRLPCTIFIKDHVQPINGTICFQIITFSSRANHGLLKIMLIPILLSKQHQSDVYFESILKIN